MASVKDKFKGAFAGFQRGSGAPIDAEKIARRQELEKQPSQPFPIEQLADPKVREVAKKELPQFEKVSGVKLSKKDKKRVRKNLDSPNKLILETQNAVEQKPQSAADKFTGAIGAFMPQLIGALVGGVLEGSEGAVAGAEMAGKMQGQVAQQEQQAKELAFKEKELGQQRELAEARLEAQNIVQQTSGDQRMKLQQDQQAFQERMKENDRVFQEKLAGLKSAGKGEGLKETESKARIFGARMYQAESEFDDVLRDFDPTDTRQRAQQFLPQEWQSKEFERYGQAKRNFLAAVLRKESGARISDEEIEQGDLQYFPQPGEGEEVVLQKTRNRNLATELMLEEGKMTPNDPRLRAFTVKTFSIQDLLAEKQRRQGLK